MSRKRSPFQIGKYWLEEDQKSPYWYYAYYSKTARRTKRKSTNCDDFELAKEWLTNFYLENSRTTGKLTQVSDVLDNYWQDHGKDLVAAPVIRTAIMSFTAFLDRESVEDIADITPRLMNRFITWRRNHSVKLVDKEIIVFEKETSPNSIQTYIKYIRAAFNWAQENEDITYMPRIRGLKKHQLNGPRREFISFDMMVKALEYAQDVPHLFNFILASIGTIARPETVLDIHANMYDGEFLDLNPDGREYTSKHRPVIALPKFMIDWLEWETGYLIQYNELPVKSIRSAWRTMRKELKWPDKIVSKTIRHSIARTLRNDAAFKKKHNLMIDRWELSGHMGHKSTGSVETTEGYAQYEPDVKSTVIQGVNAYFKELECRAKFDIHPKNTRKIKQQKSREVITL